jgi:hypothetical protein
LLEFGQDRDQAMHTERNRGVDPEAARRALPGGRKIALQLVDFLQQPGHAHAIGLAFGRQGEGAGGARDQLYAQPRLKAPQRPADGRRRKPQFPRRAGQAALSRHREERFHFAETVVHEATLVN